MKSIILICFSMFLSSFMDTCSVDHEGKIDNVAQQIDSIVALIDNLEHNKALISNRYFTNPPPCEYYVLKDKNGDIKLIDRGCGDISNTSERTRYYFHENKLIYCSGLNEINNYFQIGSPDQKVQTDIYMLNGEVINYSKSYDNVYGLNNDDLLGIKNEVELSLEVFPQLYFETFNEKHLSFKGDHSEFKEFFFPLSSENVRVSYILNNACIRIIDTANGIQIHSSTSVGQSSFVLPVDKIKNFAIIIKQLDTTSNFNWDFELSYVSF